MSDAALLRALTLSILVRAPQTPAATSRTSRSTAIGSARCASSFRHEKSLFRWAGQGPGEPGRSETIITDRPHLSEASNLVGLGTAQLETGYSYSHDSNSGVVTQGTLVRRSSCDSASLPSGSSFAWRRPILMEQTRDPVTGNTRLRGFDDLYRRRQTRADAARRHPAGDGDLSADAAPCRARRVLKPTKCCRAICSPTVG
jgi:hypothetical protein